MMHAALFAVLIAPGWLYFLGSVFAARNFAQRRAPVSERRAPISVLKPLYGAEPGLYANLRSFVEQDYPEYQIVFGVRDESDPAAAVARALIRDCPQRDATLCVASAVTGSNLKISNLENMLPHAKYDTLVLADSDMRVGPDYLAAIAAPLQSRGVGVVTCLYRGTGSGNFWSKLGALHINFGFLPSALVAQKLRLGGGCFGATIALRRELLERIGGFARLHNELADDHAIGAAVRALGYHVALSHYLVENRVFEPSAASLWRHELRWARTARLLAPAGFAGSVITHAVAIATLTAIAAGFGLTSCAFLVISFLARWASAKLVARALDLPLASPWLLLARDYLSFAVFVTSFFGKTVVWRDRLFRVEPNGEMTAVGDQAS